MIDDVTNLDFHADNSVYGMHSLHAFAAKFPPQLADWAIQRYTQPGHVICDPMTGAVRRLVEACLHGRHSIGIDIDPLACLISKAKSTLIRPSELCSANRVLLTTIEELQATNARACQAGILPDEWLTDAYVPPLPNLQRWFAPQVQVALVLLKCAIRHTPASTDIKTLWYVAFSSLIVARTSVANARDIVHSRHHYYQHEVLPNAIERFRRRIRMFERRMTDYSVACADAHVIRPEIHCADARDLPLPEESVDFVLTSPPYCNAIDYTRAHRFAIAWLADVLATSLDDYVRLGRTYIGSERAIRSQNTAPLGLPEVDTITEEVRQQDVVRGQLVARYFIDMQQVLGEIGRILRSGSHAVLIVCPSNIRRIPIAWHKAFCTIGEHLPAGQRLHHVQVIERTIYDHRRLLPYMDGNQLAQRMRTEYVLVLQKEAS
ncbi:site-specific DNA-methyltransferase [bacterium]|nr:site-specific DNA-methyltransferase [bacterium]